MGSVRIVRLKPVGLFLALGLAGLLGMLPGRAAGQVDQGITVAPAQVNMTVAKGATTVEEAVGIRNNTSVAVRLNASIRGMQPTGNGVLVPSDDAEPAIAKAMTVDSPEFTLEPGKSINVKLSLMDSRDIAPGGHYVSLLIREVRAPGNNVALSQAVSVRVFIVKEDGAVRAVTVDGVTDDGGIVWLPHLVTVSFGNSGNVAIVPRAAVQVHDPRGRLVASGTLNSESVMVLPGRQAHLQTRLIVLAKAWIPGKYKLQVTYRYDGTDQQQTGEVSMVIIPPLFWALLAVGLLTGGGIAWLVWRFWPRQKGSYAIRQPKAPKAAGLAKPQEPVAGRPVVRRRIRRRIDI